MCAEFGHCRPPVAAPSAPISTAANRCFELLTRSSQQQILRRGHLFDELTRETLELRLPRPKRVLDRGYAATVHGLLKPSDRGARRRRQLE